MKKKYALLYYMVVPIDLIEPYTKMLNNIKQTLAKNKQREEDVSIGFYIYMLYPHKCMFIYTGAAFFGSFDQIINPTFPVLDDASKIPFEAGSIESLDEFFKRAKKEIPADNYYIHIWGHGGAFFTFSLEESFKAKQIIPQNFELNSTKDLDINPENDIELRPTKKIYYIGDVQAEAYKDITLQEVEDAYNKMDNNDNLFDFKDVDLLKLQESLEIASTGLESGCPQEPGVVFLHPLPKFKITMLAAEELSNTLEINGFNKTNAVIQFSSCIMQNVEMAYQLKDCCSHIIASQDYLYKVDLENCFDLEALLNKPSANKKELVLAVVEKFKTANPNPAPAESCRCFSTIDTENVHQIDELFQKLIKLVLDNPDLGILIKKARKRCANFADDGNNTSPDLKIDLVDFTWLFLNLKMQIINLEQPLSGSQKELLTLVDESIRFSNKIIASNFTKKNREGNIQSELSYGGNGFNIIFPADIDRLNLMSDIFRSIFLSVSVGKMKFFKNLNWAEFIKKAIS